MTYTYELISQFRDAGFRPCLLEHGKLVPLPSEELKIPIPGHPTGFVGACLLQVSKGIVIRILPVYEILWVPFDRLWVTECGL